MTTILDVSTPRIDEPRVVGSKSVLVTPALMLTTAAALLTFFNVAAAVYTYRSTSNLIEIEMRLGDLKAFEDRVAGQLDTMNNGIQRRLEMLQSEFQGQLGGLRDETSRLVMPSPTSDETAIDIETGTVELDPAPVPEMEAEPPEVVEAEATEIAPPKRKASPQPVLKSSAYERIQSKDGKVYYRKMQ